MNSSYAIAPMRRGRPGKSDLSPALSQHSNMGDRASQGRDDFWDAWNPISSEPTKVQSTLKDEDPFASLASLGASQVSFTSSSEWIPLSNSISPPRKDMMESPNFVPVRPAQPIDRSASAHLRTRSTGDRVLRQNSVGSQGTSLCPWPASTPSQSLPPRTDYVFPPTASTPARQSSATMDPWEIQPLDPFASLTTVDDPFAKLSVGSVPWTPLAPTPTGKHSGAFSKDPR